MHRIIASLPAEALDLSVSELRGLRVRTLNSLKNSEIRHVRDLNGLTDNRILTWPNFGSTSLRNLKEVLARLTCQGNLGRNHIVNPESSVADLLKQLSQESLEISISKLTGLAKRTRNGLERNDISQVGDLRGMTDSRMLSWETFGRTSLRDLKSCLTDLPQLDAGESLELFDRRQLLRRSLLTVVDSCIRDLPERERRVGNERVLSNGSRQQTLDQLGQVFGITRERVRQIEKGVTDKLQGIPRLGALIDERLRGLRFGRTLPLTVGELEALDPWFEGVSDQNFRIQRLLKVLKCEHGMFRHPSLDQPFISLAAIGSIDSLKQEFLDQRPSNTSDQRDKALSVDVEVGRFVQEKDVSELRSVVLASLGDLAKGYEGPIINPRLPHWVEGVLRAAEKPLTINEIEERMRLGGHELPRSGVRGVMDRANVVLMGPSTYTVPDKLTKWDHLLPAVMEHVVSVMEADLAKQWNTIDLSRVLTDDGIVQDPRFHHHVLGYLLGECPQVVSLGRGIWCLKSAENSARLPVKELALKVLSENGAPMSRTLLEREITKRRSLGKGGLLPSWPMVSLGNGLIGLAERDLGMTERQRQQLKRELLARTSKRDLSEKEVLDVWSSINPDAPDVPLQWLLRALDLSDLALAEEGSVLRRVKEQEDRYASKARKTAEAAAVVETDTDKWRKALNSLPDEFSRADARQVLEKALKRKLPEVTLVGRLHRFGFVEIDDKWYRATTDD